VRALELAAAGLFALGGLRSLWVWTRRPFEGTDLRDHLLYALYLTGRVGLWFAIAGSFLIWSSIRTRGRAAIDEAAAYRWYLLVPLGLAGLQLVAGWFLGRRPRGNDPGDLTPRRDPRPGRRPGRRATDPSGRARRRRRT